MALIKRIWVHFHIVLCLYFYYFSQSRINKDYIYSSIKFHEARNQSMHICLHIICTLEGFNSIICGTETSNSGPAPLSFLPYGKNHTLPGIEAKTAACKAVTLPLWQIHKIDTMGQFVTQYTTYLNFWGTFSKAPSRLILFQVGTTPFSNY